MMQIKYEAEGKDKSNFTVLAKTPQTKLAAKVTAFVSEVSIITTQFKFSEILFYVT